MTARDRHQPPPVFAIRVRAPPGSDGIKELRTLLKRLGRTLGLRVVDVREEEPDTEPQS